MAAEDTQPFHWHFTEFDDRNLEIRGRTVFLLVVLFSIIILVTLLSLYARWVCRLHNHPSNYLSSTSANHNSSPLPPPPPNPRLQGLDAATISSLPIILYKSSLSAAAAAAAEEGNSNNNNKNNNKSCGIEESECCICLSLFEEGDKVKMLPDCRHCYHSECVDKWLTAQSNCPLCRVSLRVDSAVPQIVTE